MPLHDQIIPYLETAGMYHLARLNSQWFWVDEPLLSAFVERCRPETHTFHMLFGECTITLQDVTYQLGLPIDGEAVSGCLTDFENLMENGRPAWVWFRELFGELPPQNKVKQMTVCYTWFYERFWVLPADANEDTVRIYAHAYILMLLSSQLFADKNANRVHLRCFYSIGFSEGFPVSNPVVLRCSDFCWPPAYLPKNDAGGQRLVSARLSLDRLRVRDPYSSPDVAAVVHPEILVDKHRRLWTAVTSLIYFAAIEWHQNRVNSVIPVDRVANPGPSAEYLDWWCHVAHRFLSPDVAFHDPRPIVLTEEARHRGSSQAPPRVQVIDRLDNRRVDRRWRIGRRATDREWRWLDDAMDDDLGGAEDGDVVDDRVPRRRGPSAGDDGAQHADGEDVDGLGMDQPTYDVGGSSQMFDSVGPQGFADFTTAAIGMDIEDPVSQSEFFRDIADMLRDDDATHYRPQMSEVHSQFAEYQPPSQDVQP
ncbi:uncharacterized protein DS421_11g346150 [Arachis hypogaea]|nr:uncharacterized protein DS421_11g346150 [Arachis hypogaea]